MSERDPEGVIFEPDPVAPRATAPGGRRKVATTRRRLPGCLAILVAIALIAVGGWFGVTKGIDALQSAFGDPDDYPGPGTGKVTFRVDEGDSASEIGRNLKEQDVVASVEAFTNAANDARASLQPGIFALKKQMKASDVVEILGNASNDRSYSLTFLAGKTVDEIVDLLADNTDFSAKQYEKVLAKPDELGLPADADGDPEGYLYPDQYLFGPADTPETILRAMVDRYQEVADKVGLDAAAKKMGSTPHELLTIASMVQAEGRPDAQPKIARVIYNRLEIEPNPTAGFLQIDATVNYALGNKPIARLTEAQIDSVADSPYNTYRQKGLPPGPIEAPGESALDAAAHPADGPWFFYVTVNLKTGETKFTESFEEQQEFKAELDEYCDTQSDRC